ncbi:hypothetical protein [Burkholderia sp. Bp8990]|uniref:phage tail fiber protein n=1 Tax=Burkholderia sp. Bp8990 TaxID=2184552 RepID=UPI000F5B3F7B|nr:hypothetical protein [Burkholderia sp. Bp8990]
MILNLLLRGQVLIPPGSTYLALFTADPTDANVTANELVNTGYARQQIGSSLAWNSPSAGASGQQVSNVNQIVFGALQTAGATITHVGIYDAANGGNLLYHMPLAAAKVLAVGDVIAFAPGQIVIAEA